MSVTDLVLANQAIGRAGGEKIDAFNSDTPLSAFATDAWPEKKAWLLGKYRWVFADRVAQLAQLATTPPGSPFPFAYERPADLGGAIHAFRTTPDVRGALGFPLCVQQLADYIAADQTPVWAEYTAMVDASTWPSWFQELAVTAFAVDVSRRMLRRTQADEFHQLAFGTPEMNGEGGLMLDAMQADSRNAPERSLQSWDNGALVGARYGIGVGNGPSGWPNNGFPVQVVLGS